MKFTVPILTEIEATAIIVDVPVDFGDEDIPFDFPFRKNDRWRVEIDIGTGCIKDWPIGFNASFCMKVRDGGEYTLVTGDDWEDITIKNCYVPSCFPGSDSDYLDWTIDGNGRIHGWSSRPAIYAACFFPLPCEAD